MQAEAIYRIYLGVHQFLNILSYALIAYALMTWFVRPDAKIYRIMYRFCEPLLAPFRPLGQWLIRYGLRLDLTVWFAILALRLIDYLLNRLLYVLLF
ncbi:MAG: YggT family protein [Eubacteriales bacterium]|nr:YggT family protein [Eubacteriales bacterium]